MLKILLITFILIGLAFLGLAIRLLIDRKAEFKAGSCQATTDGLKDKGITCGCGGGSCSTEN